jgi:ABC-type iron transport system FetAB permease component
VPWAAIRASAQLATVAAVLAAAMMRMCSSVLVLAVMFAVASVTAAHRSQASRGPGWLAVPLGLGLAAVLPLLLLSGVVPATGVAVVPIVAIVLGNTKTATAVAARLALDTLHLRAGEVEAALSGRCGGSRPVGSAQANVPSSALSVTTFTTPSTWSWTEAGIEGLRWRAGTLVGAAGETVRGVA